MNIGHVQNYKIIDCTWKINVLILIRAYWWENWSEINKRTSMFIRNSRVGAKRQGRVRYGRNNPENASHWR